MSENHQIGSNDAKQLNLSMIISSLIIGGSLFLSASTITPNEESSNIIEYDGGKVEMGKVLSEEATFAFELYDNEGNKMMSLAASNPSQLTSKVTKYFEADLNAKNKKIDRDNKRKQDRFDYDMKSYNKALEKYNKHLATLEKGETPEYDAPEKPILDALKKHEKLKEQVFTIDGKAIVTASVSFNGTITPRFTLNLEEFDKPFTPQDEFSITDLINFIEDAADDLYSEYEDESLVS